MTQISAKIVADSISPQGHRITSMLLTYPRMIHAEMCRHRMHSRNSSSSRAIPFEKMIEKVENDPFIPVAWQKDHKGMQGNEYITEDETFQSMNPENPFNKLEAAIGVWKQAASLAISQAKYLNHSTKCGVTKQLCNRLLEPFTWHQELITATEWENFFELRCPQYSPCHATYPYRSRKDAIKDYGKSHSYLKEWTDKDWLQYSYSGAEIHIQLLAEKMWDAMNESNPQQLDEGEWHIPFGDQIDESFIKDLSKRMVSTSLDLKIKIAVARAARLSYATHDGEINYEKDIELHDRLLKMKHMSPTEHVARAMNENEYQMYVQGKKEPFMDDNAPVDMYTDSEDMQGWCKNFHGWIPYREMVEL